MKPRHILLALVLGAAGGVAHALNATEEVLFFPSYGVLSSDLKFWEIRITGGVSEPLKDPTERADQAVRLLTWMGGDRPSLENPFFKERARGFQVRPQRKRRLELDVAGSPVPMPPSKADGLFSGVVRLSTGAFMDPGPLVYFRRRPTPLDPRHFRGELFLIPRLGVSVVADLESLLTLSKRADRTGLAAGLFLEAYVPMEGAADVFAAWGEEGRLFHYVSAAPRPLYGPLRQKMDETGFPPGVYHLRDTTVRGRGGKKFFRAAEGFKRETLERLFREFPDRRFVLVGDVYDKDPEIFGAMGRAHLRQIEHIYIWDPNGVNRHTVRYDKAFQGVPPFLWSVAQNAGDMMR